jgi:CRISPR-associated protein Cas2
MTTNYLVCYDIRCVKRLRKVHKTVLGYGIPVQKSIFLALLTPEMLAQLINKLNKVIDCEVDDVKIYPIADCDLNDWPKSSLTGNEKCVFLL